MNITPEAIKQYAIDYETRTRQEKERELEFENLRIANAGLAAKIRTLEERAEKSDSDHVQVATEMIRHKMENEDLKTHNEELKGEIEALKKIVSSQPEEVEARLKDEMERIITRNSEVQNENRALEEQMTDMEKDLVHAKMQYAQVSILIFGLYMSLKADHCQDQRGLREHKAEVVGSPKSPRRVEIDSDTKTYFLCFGASRV